MIEKIKKNYINNEEIIYEASKKFKPYLETFIGVLMALVLAFFQQDFLISLNLFYKFVLVFGLLFITMQSFDYFFLEILLTKNQLYIKSIFTIGKFIKIDLVKIKSIKVTSIYFKDKFNQGNIILNIHKWIPIPLGIIKDAYVFKQKFDENQLKEK